MLLHSYYAILLVTQHDTSADESYLTLRSGVMEQSSSHANPIIHAFTKHKLQNFVISNDCLRILELLGGGEM